MDNENTHRAMEMLHISGSKYDLPRVQLLWSADEEPARLGANLAIPTSSARLFSLKPCNYALSVNSLLSLSDSFFSALQLCSQFLVLKYPAACTVNLKTLESLSISLLMWFGPLWSPQFLVPNLHDFTPCSYCLCSSNLNLSKNSSENVVSRWQERRTRKPRRRRGRESWWSWKWTLGQCVHLPDDCQKSQNLLSGGQKWRQQKCRRTL